jgi:hypothetical protein
MQTPEELEKDRQLAMEHRASDEDLAELAAKNKKVYEDRSVYVPSARFLPIPETVEEAKLRLGR